MKWALLMAAVIVAALAGWIMGGRKTPDIVAADRSVVLLTIDDPSKPAPVEYVAVPRGMAADMLGQETIKTRNLEARPQRPGGRFGCVSAKP